MAINKDEVVSELLQKALGQFDCQVPRPRPLLPGYTAKGRGYHLEITYWPLLLPWGKSGGTDGNVINGKELHRKLHRDDGGFHLWGLWRPSFYHWRFDKGCWSVRVRRWLGRRGCRHSSSGSPPRVRMWPGNTPRPVQTCAGLWKKASWDRGFGNWEYGAETIQNSCMLGPFWLTPPLTAGHTASSRGQAHVDILFLARINCQFAIRIHLCYRRSAARLPRW